MKNVKIYTTPSCTYCKSVKELLNENNIPFEEVDITTDLSLRDEVVERSGQLGVPVTIIDDEDVVVGFDEAKLKLILGIS